MLTVHLGPTQIVAALSLDFHDQLTAGEIEACVERIELAIKARAPEIVGVFVKPQKSAVWNERRRAIVG